MKCLLCPAAETRVVDSRLAESGRAVRRRRRCEACGARFTTYERYAGHTHTLAVRKRDGTTQPYDREKLLRGLIRATNKRPISNKRLEDLVDQIEVEISSAGNEVGTDRIGELALLGLKERDQVAYIRFASVYRDFDGVDDFAKALAGLDRDVAATGTAPPERAPRRKSNPKERSWGDKDATDCRPMQ